MKSPVKILIACAALAAAAAATASQPVGELVRHVRFEAPRTSTRTVALRWDDSLRVEADIVGCGADDPLTGLEIPYRYYVGDSLAAEGRAPLRYEGSPAALSLVLRVWRDGAAVDIGSRHAAATIPVDYDRLAGDIPDYDNPHGLRVLRNTASVEALPALRTAPYVCVDSLIDAVKSSSDPVEGVWTYLDRENERATAVPGGFYTLAALREADGSYSLVYLDGARHQSVLWAPLRVKGRLRPTRFADHYDLEWLDAEGRPVASENHASYDAEAGILALRFPLLNAVMRFSKVD